MNSRIDDLIVRARIRYPIAMRRLKRLSAPFLRFCYRSLGHFSSINHRPVFIYGHHKSGTTAVAKLLAEATRTRLASDLFNAWESYPLEELVLEHLSFTDYVNSKRYHFSAGIIKEPDFTYIHDQVSTAFPEARFVFIVRDPRETIRSILDRLSFPGDQTCLTAGMIETLSTLPGWKMILDPSPLAIRDAHYIAVLAHRWRLAAEVYLRHSNTVALIKYEDFCRAPQSSIENLATALGLPIKADISKISRKNFQPPGTRNRRWQEVFGDRNLQRIEDICGNIMMRLGYEPILPRNPVEQRANLESFP